MQLDNRPLTGTLLDRELFVPPREWERLRAAVDRNLNVLVLGEPGAGKTSLLRMLATENESRRRTVYVDLAPARHAAESLALILESLGARDVAQAWGDTLHGSFVPPSSSASRLLRLARRLGDAQPALILVDSPPGDGESHTLFGRLRDELWQHDHRWVVAAPTRLRDELARPPADSFFDVRIELQPMDVDSQKTLLERRLSGDPDVDVESLVGLTQGLPRALLEVAREAVLGGRPADEVLSARERDQGILADMPAGARQLADYLAARGPTSASDADLARAMGFSPQRARVLLEQLVESGLARTFEERSEGRGRPRKLYALRRFGEDA